MKQVTKKRVFLIVLDSVGIGAMPDSDAFGDYGVNTLRSASNYEGFCVPNLQKLGLFHIDGTSWAEEKGLRSGEPQALYGRMKEASKGKDTTIGHWEIAGIISENPLPTYPQGFPGDLLDAFSRETGRGILCNRPYSGTDVIRDYGQEHLDTGKLIVYTSADSVFQIAAHEEIVPREQLYEYCRIARKLLTGEHGVGRVIARPFVGKEGSFTRTSGRHDYSLEPPAPTMLDYIKAAGKEVLSIGKIQDIFAGQGITSYCYTTDNGDGIQKLLEHLELDFEGLCFVNLVDYDMLYGHRRDIAGYGKALNAFDEALPEILARLREEDLLIITADHGCDPAYTKTTDHTREYTPMLLYGAGIATGNLGTRESFADIGASILEVLQVPGAIQGKSFFA